MKFKRMDFECITDRYKRNIDKTQVKMFLNRNKTNKFTFSEFIENIRSISDSKVELLGQQFKGMWDVEKNVYLFIIFFLAGRIHNYK